MKAPQNRLASRLIVMDSQGRILLFQHIRRNGERFWSPPGGGVEAGETFEEAALREASEELGLTSVRLTFLWEDLAEFTYIDHPVRQRERFYSIAGDFSNLFQGVDQIHQAESIAQAKWWSLAEIESTKESVFPEKLADKIRR